jgi:hypothetical protein
MVVEAIPEEVVRFLDAYIDTIDQLEILRVLGDQPAKEWQADELARAVQAKAQTIGTHLAALQARGLVTGDLSGGELLWRHGARTPELEGRVAQLLHVYRERPVTLIKMVYDKAGARLRAFAEAFRVREGG